ncbi:MAG: hypothetical protein MI810_18895, partial [Flavobacteriales bacterium]|nr:hypothetical protein [Flavobacteriales bacterium]
MMRKTLLFAFFSLILLTSNNSFSQAKKVWLYNADQYYEKMDFASALRYYHKVMDDTLALSFRILPYETVLTNQKLKNLGNKKDSALAKISVGDYIHHQMAMCYRYSHDYPNAAKHFRASSASGSYNDDYYFLGNTLMYQGKYDSALAVFEHYMTLEEYTDMYMKRALGDMSGCAAALKMPESDEDIVINFSDTTVFNKGTSSFATTYWHGTDEERIVFTSAREGGIVLDPLVQDSRYLCDLYWTEKDGDGWSAPKNFGRPLNSARHDASGVFNGENIIYYTRWSDENKKEKHIYLARMIGNKFFESMKLDSMVNMPGYESINPFISSDRQWMYFSSNRPGTLGGMDLWRIKLDDNGNPIGEPENLKKPVNSEFDEVSPFYHEKSNILFFSSDGHNSMGGLDIFRSVYSKDIASFGIPANMGQPI